MKRKPYVEGDWFAVPLGSGFVLSRIVRVGKRGGILVGYFFGPLRTAVPTADDTVGLAPDDAFGIVRFGDRGLVEDGWPIIVSSGVWSRNEWPMPAFGRINEFASDRGYRVQYDEADLSLCVSETEITAAEALYLPDDGLSGHVYLQRRLEKYFKEGQPAYDPKARSKVYSWYRGLPRSRDA